MDNQQDLKKWELKVAVHCDGCARKVRKVLQRIDGVYRVSVDSAKQKVTVEGDSKLNPDVLVKKLAKTGKPVELLPEVDPKQKPSSDENKAEPSPQKDGGDKEEKKKKPEDAGSEQKGKNTEKDKDGSASVTGDTTACDVVQSAKDGGYVTEIRQDLSHPPPPESLGFYPFNPSVVQYTVHYHTVDPYAVHPYRPGQAFCCEMPGHCPPPAYPPANLHFNTDMFNDENTGSCTLM
ncbi:heavy metal-associated isoprenylated plant protein 35-like [Nymphaea colorata]|nr:heavy metal-associated isoprenylated plant protein 35-like [Nymphaea colorata]